MNNRYLSGKEVFMGFFITFVAIYIFATHNGSDESLPKSQGKTNQLDKSKETRLLSMDEVQQITKKESQRPENQAFVNDFRKNLKKHEANRLVWYKNLEVNEVRYNGVSITLTYDSELSAAQAPNETEELVRYVVQSAVRYGKKPVKESFFVQVNANLKAQGETEERFIMLGWALYNYNTDSVYWEDRVKSEFLGY